MKTEKEIIEKSERLKKILDDQMNYFYAFSPSSYDDLNEKMKEIQGEFNIISNVIETEDELRKLVKEKRDFYRTNPSSILKGEIIGIRWILD